MRWISWLFRWKRKSRYRWFGDEYRGSMKVRIGQKLSSGDLELVLRLEAREAYGKWATIATVRHADVPVIRQLLVDADRYLKTLLSHE